MKALIIYASVHHGTFYQGHFETPVTEWSRKVAETAIENKAV